MRKNENSYTERRLKAEFELKTLKVQVGKSRRFLRQGVKQLEKYFREGESVSNNRAGARRNGQPGSTLEGYCSNLDMRW